MEIQLLEEIIILTIFILQILNFFSSDKANYRTKDKNVLLF